MQADLEDLTGVIDMHIHTAPDLRPRKLDALEAARQATARGMRAIVLKSHWTLTADRARIVQCAVPGIQVRGGLALNASVGGFNPAAVEAALEAGAAVIWMPTISAAAHRHPAPANGLTLAGNRPIRPEIFQILQLIAAADAILATGHLSVPEIMNLVPAARQSGVRKIVITHPEHPPVEMSALQQEELRDRYGVLFERCLISTEYGGGSMRLAEVAGIIRRVGFQSTILATDFGQPDNAFPVDGMAQWLSGLRAEGFPTASLRRMSQDNPASLLDL
jgi:hypothetical protein